MPVQGYDVILLGMPSPEALLAATNAMRSRCVLPETLQHHEVKSECLRLAYLIQAYGLTSTERRHVSIDERSCRMAASWNTESSNLPASPRL